MDNTTRDLDRRNLDIVKDSVRRALPEHFVEQYPLIIQFLEYYYEFLRESSAMNPTTGYLADLLLSRDLQQVDESLLNFIEDELLLGQSYFSGFKDKRQAAQLNSNLYNAKGSRYSIQQFFRMFYGLDAELIYTKKFVFRLNDSDLAVAGTASQLVADGVEEHYLTNDKLYQTYALLIKVALPIGAWRDAYKLFVHPAGMYIAAEVQILTTVDATITAIPVQGLDDAPVVAVETSSLTFSQAFGDVTAIIPDDSASYMRMNVNQHWGSYEEFEGTDSAGMLTIADMDEQYRSLEQALEATSPTFDIDSDVFGTPAISMDNTIETMDQDQYLWWYNNADDFLGILTDTDSDGYYLQIDTRSNTSRI